MPIRRDPVREAGRRARQQVEQTLAVVRDARVSAGVSQNTMASALGCSRQLIGAIEAGRLDDVGCIQLARMGAVVGLDVPIRAYPGGSPLRDVGQLRLLDRFRGCIGDGWTWQTEVPVRGDSNDRRAIDAVLMHSPIRVGVEAVTRFLDVQGQVRSIVLKQQAAGLACMLIVLADTRHNRHALVEGAPTIRPAFPLASRAVLSDLRAGRPPESNGVVLV